MNAVKHVSSSGNLCGNQLPVKVLVHNEEGSVAILRMKYCIYFIILQRPSSMKSCLNQSQSNTVFRISSRQPPPSATILIKKPL